MLAVVTTGNGGFERLEIQSIPIPELGPGEVLLQVLAAGVNNTDINTRVGWYASTVVLGTDTTARASETAAVQEPQQGWNGATPSA